MRTFKDFEAVIFDMDGLLVGSEQIARRGWQAAATEFGYTIDDILFGKLLGRSWGDAREILKETLGTEFPADKIRERRIVIGNAEIAETGMPIQPGAKELILYLHELNIPYAVATSAERQFAEKRLAQAGIRNFFEIIVTGEEVKQSKPAPDIFLLAATRLGVSPEKCLVLEDAASGVFAARSAGMSCFLVPDLIEVTEELKESATGIFDSLHDVLLVLREGSEE